MMQITRRKYLTGKTCHRNHRAVSRMTLANELIYTVRVIRG